MLSSREKLTVKSSLREYPIFIGAGIFSQIFEYVSQRLQKKKLYLIVDQNVFHQCSFVSKEINLQKNLDIHSMILPHGESTKSLDHVDNLYGWLLKNSADRNSVICAIGGGVVGDTAGFVASTFMRGVDIIQIPTTLLSMVDSSIGGKVGINHDLGKNMIGSFYPPHAVFIDLDFLNTLPTREFSTGMAECIKHGLISSEDLYLWYQINLEKILKRDNATIHDLIIKNLNVKANIVEKDEKEQNIRAFLNFGHTFGHAIEKSFAYSDKILHGEAVSLGICAALKLSELRLNLSCSLLNQTKDLLSSFGLPISFDLPAFDKIFDCMKLDKKNKNDKVRFVLINKIGSPIIIDDLGHSEILMAYDEIKK